MACSIAPTQCLAKLQEGNEFLAQVEVAQKKEDLLKARLGPWLDKSYQVMNKIQEKLMGLQQAQQTIKLVVEGPAMAQLVEEDKQATMQSIVEVGGLSIDILLESFKKSWKHYWRS